jgi:hypothetical protein
MIRAFVILAALLALTGCRWSARGCPTTPVIVEVPVPVREPIPAALTAPVDASACAVEGPTVGDVRRQRAAACVGLEIANDRLQRIRELRSEAPQ